MSLEEHAYFHNIFLNLDILFKRSTGIFSKIVDYWKEISNVGNSLVIFYCSNDVPM